MKKPHNEDLCEACAMGCCILTSDAHLLRDVNLRTDTSVLSRDQPEPGTPRRNARNPRRSHNSSRRGSNSNDSDSDDSDFPGEG